LGRISYLNVLPVYYPLDAGIVAHDFHIVSGPPARLNELAASGQLDISATSSIEYARHQEAYYLVPDLAIGSQGPVQSVLLLSRIPLERLEGRTILVSSQTHTSAALLRLLLDEHLGIEARFESGDISSRLEGSSAPPAFLAIGDEALRLRRHPRYPHALDLGQAWQAWTGLPFIFGVWVASAAAVERCPEALRRGCARLVRGKEWGKQRLDFFAALMAKEGILPYTELASYFRGLVYDLGSLELEGLRFFYRRLAERGEIKAAPELSFLSLSPVWT
jgi:chorismate dehydratase